MRVRKLVLWISTNRRLTLNFAMMCVWLAVLPMAYFLNWLASVVFVSLVSIFALVETRAAAWFAEMKLMKEAERQDERRGE